MNVQPSFQVGRTTGGRDRAIARLAAGRSAADRLARALGGDLGDPDDVDLLAARVVEQLYLARRDAETLRAAPPVATDPERGGNGSTLAPDPADETAS